MVKNQEKKYFRLRIFEKNEVFCILYKKNRPTPKTKENKKQ